MESNKPTKRSKLLKIIAILSLLLACVTLALVYVTIFPASQPSVLDLLPQPSAAKKSDLFWTKKGLERIPLSNWSSFSPNMDLSPYLDIPFPGDEFTSEHLRVWSSVIERTSLKTLLSQGLISNVEDLESVNPVPTLFTSPIFLKESAIDYRLQFAADKGSRLIAQNAVLGRLVNPAGRRLQEHFYRFPDQCDATPIALEVFLRLMIYDQIEAFFRTGWVGLWHDLFPEVERRPYNAKDLNLARWYGERYAESYLHKINNGWVYPRDRQAIDTFMIAVGLDPEDTSEDPSNPIGLGNLVGKRVTGWMNSNDGLKRESDFVDEIGLQRIEDRHLAPAWHQWKPTLAGSGRFQGIRFGIVTRQTFVSPSLGIMSFLYDNETDFIDLGLQDAVPPLNVSEAAYIERAQRFLSVQTGLTDRQKAIAELSNNKITGSVFLIKAFVPLLKKLAPAEDYSSMYDEFSMVTSGCAEYAATHAAWRHKRTYLAGRPKSVLRELASRNSQFRHAHPEAENFEPLIPAGDHPEYPSGSSAIYSAFAQAGDDWFQKRLNFSDASKNTGTLKFVIPASGFYWSNGPENDIELEYDSLDSWIQELPASRVYGGVHWFESGEAGLMLGKKVGHACGRLLDRLRAGEMGATYTSASRQKVEPFNSN